MPNHPNTSELEPEIKRVAVDMCELCLAGKGGECHTPGCLFCFLRQPAGLQWSWYELGETVATAQAQGRREGWEEPPGTFCKYCGQTLNLPTSRRNGWHDECWPPSPSSGQPKTVTSVSGDTPENRSNTAEGTVTESADSDTQIPNVVSSDTRTCGECRGTGLWSDGQPDPCSRCHGTGRLPAKEETNHE